MEMPILSEIYEILYHGKRPGDALVELMGRDLNKSDSPVDHFSGFNILYEKHEHFRKT